VKNKLIDLNNHLFAQLEKLSDDDLKADALQEELARSKAISGLASQIIHNAKLALDAHKSINEGLIKSAPEMIGMKVTDE
jgi:hypothetical protein